VKYKAISGLNLFTRYEKVLRVLRYGDGAGNTIEENSSIFSIIRMH